MNVTTKKEPTKRTPRTTKVPSAAAKPTPVATKRAVRKQPLARQSTQAIQTPVEQESCQQADPNAVVMMPTPHNIKMPRSSYTVDIKYTGDEPMWDADIACTLSEEQFDSFFRKSMMFYNYHYTQKDLKKIVVQWMQKFATRYFSEEKIREFTKVSDRLVTQTVCNIVAAHLRGMPLKQRHIDYIIKSVDNAIELSKRNSDDTDSDSTTPSNKPQDLEVKKPTIQERLQEKTAEILGEFEYHFDNELVAKTNFKMYDFLTENKVPQNQLNKYEENVKRKLAELSAVQKKEDEQLVEGYKNLKLSQIKNLTAFLTECLKSIDQYRGVKQATKKLRVKKAPSKDKLVSKLNYKKEDQALRVVSVPAHTIVGAKTLWVYNTRTRKIGKYVADATAGQLSVKGSTIIGFDEKLSVCKTLRKPLEQLQEFSKASKIKLRKFLEEIKAVETPLNGRINADTILLRVDG